MTALHHGVHADTSGLLLYASTKDEPKSRRPTDLALGLLSALILIIAATVSQIGDNLDAAFAGLVNSLPRCSIRSGARSTGRPSCGRRHC